MQLARAAYAERRLLRQSKRAAKARKPPAPASPRTAMLRIQRQVRRMLVQSKLRRLLQPFTLALRPLSSSFHPGDVLRHCEWQLSLTHQAVDGALKGAYKTAAARMDGSRVFGQAIMLPHVRHTDRLRLSLMARASLDRDRVRPTELLGRGFRREGRLLVSTWVSFYERDIGLLGFRRQQEKFVMPLRGQGGRFAVPLFACMSAGFALQEWVGSGAVKPVGKPMQQQQEGMAASLLPETVTVVIEAAPTCFHSRATLAMVHPKARLLDGPVLEPQSEIEVRGRAFTIRSKHELRLD